MEPGLYVSDAEQLTITVLRVLTRGSQWTYVKVLGVDWNGHVKEFYVGPDMWRRVL